MAAEHLGPWAPLSPEEGARLFSDCTAAWWVAGGWAIDLLVGGQGRPHGDLDVLVLRPEQHVVRSYLKAWDVHAADPPGSLRPWPIAELLPPSVHDIWCRRGPSAPWSFQLMIDVVDRDEWLFRRDHRIRRPVSSLFGRASRPGLPVLAPEVQLLYKSGSPGAKDAPRDKDAYDLARALPHLALDERNWLLEALRVTCRTTIGSGACSGAQVTYEAAHALGDARSPRITLVSKGEPGERGGSLTGRGPPQMKMAGRGATALHRSFIVRGRAYHARPFC